VDGRLCGDQGSSSHSGRRTFITRAARKIGEVGGSCARHSGARRSCELGNDRALHRRGSRGATESGGSDLIQARSPRHRRRPGMSDRRVCLASAGHRSTLSNLLFGRVQPFSLFRAKMYSCITADRETYVHRNGRERAMGGRSLLCLASHTLVLWTAVGLVFSQPISSTNEKTTLRLCQGRNQSANVGDEPPICLRPEPFSQARLLLFS